MESFFGRDAASRRLAGEGGRPTLCERDGKIGWFLPLTQDEWQLNGQIRGTLYGLTMVYFFLGVAIIADIFMSAIEEITSRKRKVKRDGKEFTVAIWNDTVATLSLMALGSSAPEIFLSVMETFKNNFHFSSLGPSTIVGSASFNLLVIVSVCVIAVPSDELRVIKDLPAFYVTAIFSLFAYMIMSAFLVMTSPDVVEMWEALFTLACFPLLIFVSYKTDVGSLNCIFSRLGVEKDDGGSETPGTLIAFKSEQLSVESDAKETQTVTVPVYLSKCDAPLSESGPVTVAWRTERYTAMPEYDYGEADGMLEFAEADAVHELEIEVLARPADRGPCQFLVILEEPSDGAGFPEENDGAGEMGVCTITVAQPKGARAISAVDRKFNVAHLNRGWDHWKDQFREACFVNGSPEEQKEASYSDIFFHFLTMPWKFTFALIPPAAFFHGWACFVFAIAGIGVLSAILSDIAEMFGCCWEVPDIVTAITFVALGTSMPDLFASLVAAKEDATADASIVNVTGSNGVNVFLGLGIPWTMSAIYWQEVGRTDEWVQRYSAIVEAQGIQGNAFVVDSTNLGFSVSVFIMACCAALFILWARRKVIGGELGGEYWCKWSTFGAFIAFWLGSVMIVSWRVLRWGLFSNAEYMGVQGSLAIIMLCFFLWPLILMYRVRKYDWPVVTALPEIEEEPVSPPAADTGGTGAPAPAPGMEESEGSSNPKVLKNQASNQSLSRSQTFGATQSKSAKDQPKRWREVGTNADRRRKHRASVQGAAALSQGALSEKADGGTPEAARSSASSREDDCSKGARSNEASPKQPNRQPIFEERADDTDPCDKASGEPAICAPAEPFVAGQAGTGEPQEGPPSDRPPVLAPRLRSILAGTPEEPPEAPRCDDEAFPSDANDCGNVCGNERRSGAGLCGFVPCHR